VTTWSWRAKRITWNSVNVIPTNSIATEDWTINTRARHPSYTIIANDWKHAGHTNSNTTSHCFLNCALMQQPFPRRNLLYCSEHRHRTTGVDNLTSMFLY
jgi:hypothetical protein